MKLTATALTALAPAVWGTTYIVTSEFLPPEHPLFASLVRALPAGLLAIALARKLPRGSWWLKSAVLGILNIGAFFPLLFLAAYRLPGGVAATLGAFQPLIVALLVVPILSERLSQWRILWGIVGLAGVALVVLRSSAALDITGVVAGLLGPVSMGLGVVLTKKWGRPEGVSGIALAGWQLTAGGLVLLPVTLLFKGVPQVIDADAALGYAWLGLVGGLLAYTLWFSGIRNLPVTAVAVLALLSPLVAATLGAIVLDEVLTPAQLLGFALALAAIVASQLTPPAPRRRDSIRPPRPPESATPALHQGIAHPTNSERTSS